MEPGVSPPLVLKVLQIGSTRVHTPVALAPMAGVTDLPFRLLCKEFGAGLVFSEMVSAKGLVYGNTGTMKLLDTVENEQPVGFQLFGSDTDIMAKAAGMLRERGAQLIDINMGCPVPKVVRQGEGAALMRNPVLAGKVVEAVVKASGCPVTVKMRKGWDDLDYDAVEIARVVESAGASAVTIHGRTREQYYSGKADWEIIGRVKSSVRIPVIGNGDIWQPEDAARMFSETGCDGVMIGRAALGNPWMFRRVTHYLLTGEVLPEPGWQERITLALKHLDMTVDYKGGFTGVREMRKHLSWYIKGLPQAAATRDAINHCSSQEALHEVLERYRDFLANELAR